MGSFIHYTLSGGIFAFAHIRTLLNASFICNFLSFSAGFNLCSCFFRLTFDFRFHFRLSLGLTFHDQLPLPANFLTPAVFAFFRPLQFWVLTTQPLFLPFPFFTVSPHSGFPAATSTFRLSVFSRSDPPGFPCFSFRSRSWLSVCFLSSFLASLPQPFHKCSHGVDPYATNTLAFSPSVSLSFVHYTSGFDYSAFCFFRSRSSPFRFTVASRSRLLPFGFPSFPVPISLVSHASLSILGNWLLFVSFRPSLLHSHTVPQVLAWRLPLSVLPL